MEKFTKAILEPIVGDAVRLTDPELNQVELTLSSVEETSTKNDDWESFRVTLKGDESFHIPQGTYRISHNAFGDQELFLCPNSSTEYEIIVSGSRQ